MKVNDAISAYDFLSKFDWFGVIGLLIAASILITFFVLNIADKLFEERITKRVIAVVTLVFVNICICILKIEADRNNDLVSKADTIKSFMIENNVQRLGLKYIAENVDFSDKIGCKVKDINCVDNRVIEIEKIVNRYPDDFVITTVPSDLHDDTLGVELINQSVLRTFTMRNEKLYPLLKEKILNYMKVSNRDTLNYGYIADYIDTRCDENTLDMIISRNPKLFISIYAPYDVYANNNNKKEDFSDALEISPDSAKEILKGKTIANFHETRLSRTRGLKRNSK